MKPQPFSKRRGGRFQDGRVGLADGAEAPPSRLTAFERPCLQSLRECAASVAAALQGRQNQSAGQWKRSRFRSRRASVFKTAGQALADGAEASPRLAAFERPCPQAFGNAPPVAAALRERQNQSVRQWKRSRFRSGGVSVFKTVDQALADGAEAPPSRLTAFERPYPHGLRKRAAGLRKRAAGRRLFAMARAHRPFPRRPWKRLRGALRSAGFVL